jgi:general secretion pathway protein D
MKTKTITSIVLTLSLLFVPVVVLAKKGERNFKKGMQYEQTQQWDKAAQEFTLALAADPSNMEYQLHFRRASFNASQHYMQQGRTLAEQSDFVGAYNAFREAYGYDPVNELAVSEMERMLRLQNLKEGRNTRPEQTTNNGAPSGPTANGPQPEDFLATTPEQLRVITYHGDLKAFIRSLAEQLNLNVIFDRTSFAQLRTIDINLSDVTTAQALDYVFVQEGLFFQKLSHRTILVADQGRRNQYQQLVLKTFFLSNMKPTDARTFIQQAFPPTQGRLLTIVPDDATNSLTVRDTAENVRLIGELLRNIDKDRAEVVMDVNIYEVTKTDMLQLGNQIGNPANVFNIGASPGFSLLTDNAVTGAGRGVNLGAITAGVPTALAAALVIPPSVLTAFQSKGNTKLVASTQVHAFNGEESQARIGQRVPVQTAQAYPFGVQTGQPSTGNIFPTGGVPVINYEPTGLTLKFTPQVFPNLDVQVKMSIESKDVFIGGGLTPTFSERSITGTARVQNNRTMLLASVSHNSEARGRKGLPVLGGLPFLGRLFTAPTRDDRQIDVVIAVTPRVLRAPTIGPRDEEMRPSGTFTSPTTGSLAEMIRDADRDERIEATRLLKKEAVIGLPVALLKAAPKSASGTINPQPNDGAATAAAPATVATPNVENNIPAQGETVPSLLPAPKSLVSNRAASEMAIVNPTNLGSGNAVLSSLQNSFDTSLNSKPGSKSDVAQIRFLPTDDVLRVGDKRRYAVQMNSEVAWSFAVFSIQFDPKVLKVSLISPGNLIGTQPAALTYSIDPSGVCLISISSPNGRNPIKGNGLLFFIDVEALGLGIASLSFDREAVRLLAVDGTDLRSSTSNWKALVH